MDKNQERYLDLKAKVDDLAASAHKGVGAARDKLQDVIDGLREKQVSAEREMQARQAEGGSALDDLERAYNEALDKLKTK